MSNIEGPHELAWETMLDLICADACHHKIGTIDFAVGIEQLFPRIEIRRGIPRAPSNYRASAWLCKTGTDTQIDRLYTVSMAGRPLSVNGIWTLERAYYVLTWKVRWMGAIIRLASWLRQPQWGDEGMYRMRKLFMTERPTNSVYTLQIWNRKV